MESSQKWRQELRMLVLGALIRQPASTIYLPRVADDPDLPLRVAWVTQDVVHEGLVV